jgi:hypothetical protein
MRNAYDLLVVDADQHAAWSYKPDITARHDACTTRRPGRCTAKCRVVALKSRKNLVDDEPVNGTEKSKVGTLASVTGSPTTERNKPATTSP